MKNTVDFRSSIDIEKIKKLEEQIDILQTKLKLANSDIKKLLTHDYETVCDFCGHGNCCYRFSSRDCKRNCHWRGRHEEIYRLDKQDS